MSWVRTCDGFCTKRCGMPVPRAATATLPLCRAISVAARVVAAVCGRRCRLCWRSRTRLASFVLASAALGALGAAAARIFGGGLCLGRRGARRQAFQRGAAQAPARVSGVVSQAERPAAARVCVPYFQSEQCVCSLAYPQVNPRLCRLSGRSHTAMSEWAAGCLS